jgi:hypothetical protein
MTDFEERRKFAIGDRVRPIDVFRGDPQLPQGAVRAVSPFGRGQALYIGDAKRAYLSGFFEIDAADVAIAAATNREATRETENGTLREQR